ncbi:hypothetical protein Cfor_06771 [Coptotermes formosanus]|uniref:Uncharacterized protein n=1 Tax=Coptotermes formosanus TaxID=36987 RepID=A0A6L2PFD7_COPFO|nr:hypothetical protein Cfor_06771 [Coptotermes formosanus]
MTLKYYAQRRLHRKYSLKCLPLGSTATFKVFSFLTLYTALIQGGMIIGGALIWLERIEYLKQEKPQFGQVMIEATFLGTFILLFMLPFAHLVESEAIRSYGRQATPAKLKTTSCNKYCTGTAVMFCSNIIPVSHTEKPQALVRSSVVLLRVLLCDERNDVAHEWPRADNSSKDTDGTIRASK